MCAGMACDSFCELLHCLASSHERLAGKRGRENAGGTRGRVKPTQFFVRVREVVR